MIVSLVMEIFMCYDMFDVFVVFVGCCFWFCKNVFCIEDVEFFVFYGFYVEVVDSDDYVKVEIVFEVVDFFVLMYWFF